MRESSYDAVLRVIKNYQNPETRFPNGTTVKEGKGHEFAKDVKPQAADLLANLEKGSLGYTPGVVLDLMSAGIGWDPSAIDRAYLAGIPAKDILRVTSTIAQENIQAIPADHLVTLASLLRRACTEYEMKNSPKVALAMDEILVTAYKKWSTIYYTASEQVGWTVSRHLPYAPPLEGLFRLEKDAAKLSKFKIFYKAVLETDEAFVFDDLVAHCSTRRLFDAVEPTKQADLAYYLADVANYLHEGYGYSEIQAHAKLALAAFCARGPDPQLLELLAAFAQATGVDDLDGATLPDVVLANWKGYIHALPARALTKDELFVLTLLTEAADAGYETLWETAQLLLEQ